jgi:hypothetical protein
MPPDTSPAFGGSLPGWLFRGSEAAWDVLSASLMTDPSQAAPWPIAPSGPSMAEGDRVLLWRSGRDGGIAAVCTVLDEPIATVGNGGRPLVTVDIRVDRAFGRPISPTELLAHDELRSLAFMDLLDMTERRVTPDQAESLAELIIERERNTDRSDAGGPPADPRVMTSMEVPAKLVGLVTELLTRLGASEPPPPRTDAPITAPPEPRPDEAASGPTEQQVEQAAQAAAVHGQDAFTVDEVAITWRTGVGTARSRIERLLESGLVERAGTRALNQPGTSRPARGRPPVLYRLRSSDLLER